MTSKTVSQDIFSTRYGTNYTAVEINIACEAQRDANNLMISQ